MVSTADPLSIAPADLHVRRIGESAILSPLAGLVQGRVSSPHYVHESDRVLLDDTLERAEARLCGVADLPSLEPGGPREYIYFDPSRTRAGIVTCGGLCPGLNNVIRGLVLQLADNYGVSDVVGFRDGFRGLAGPDVTPVRLTREVVSDIHNRGGTILGTSRGDQDPALMVETLVRLGISVLFVIGGDGSLRGAAKIAYGPEKVANVQIETETHKAAALEFGKQVAEKRPSLKVQFGLMAADGKVEMYG